MRVLCHACRGQRTIHVFLSVHHGVSGVEHDCQARYLHPQSYLTAWGFLSCVSKSSLRNMVGFVCNVEAVFPGDGEMTRYFRAGCSSRGLRFNS